MTKFPSPLQRSLPSAAADLDAELDRLGDASMWRSFARNGGNAQGGMRPRLCRKTCSPTALEQRRALGLAAVAAQRKALDRLQADNRLNADEYNLLLEELDWRALTLLPAEKRRVKEQ
jgi:hypothetical protein